MAAHKGVLVMTKKFAVAVYSYPDSPGELYLGGRLLGPFDSDENAWRSACERRDDLAGTRGPPDHILVLDARLVSIAAKRVDAAA
jgi:hypothetical protein